MVSIRHEMMATASEDEVRVLILVVVLLVEEVLHYHKANGEEANGYQIEVTRRAVIEGEAVEAEAGKGS